jgi:hypothetical protein
MYDRRAKLWDLVVLGFVILFLLASTVHLG